LSHGSDVRLQLLRVSHSDHLEVVLLVDAEDDDSTFVAVREGGEDLEQPTGDFRGRELHLDRVQLAAERAHLIHQLEQFRSIHESASLAGQGYVSAFTRS